MTRWTREQPTVEGWYWYKDQKTPEQPVFVYQTTNGSLCELWRGDLQDLDNLRGEWAGPIPEPEE